MLSLMLSACSQPAGRAVAQPVPAPAASPSSYDALLGRLKAGDATVDFTALRMGYAASPSYQPMGSDAAAQKRMNDARQSGDMQATIAAAKVLLDANYLDIMAHLVLQFAYGQVGDAPKATFHRQVAVGLLRSVTSVGDGRSAATAHPVIAVDEEYALLAVMGLRRQNQALLQEGGKHIDRLETVGQDGRPTVLYFDVSLLFAAYPHALGLTR